MLQTMLCQHEPQSRAGSGGFVVCLSIVLLVRVLVLCLLPVAEGVLIMSAITGSFACQHGGAFGMRPVFKHSR